MKLYSYLQKCFLVLMATAVTGCSSSPWEDVTLSPSVVYKRLAEAQEILFKGKMKRDQVHSRSSIWIGEECVGGVLEQGLLDSKHTLVVGKEKLFRFEYGDLEMEGEITATTFTYYSQDDQIIGYAQETVIKNPDMEEEDYVFLFYDENKNRKPYFLLSGAIWNLGAPGRMLAEVEDDLAFSFSGKYTIKMTIYVNRIDLVDKIFLYRYAIDKIERRIPM